MGHVERGWCKGQLEDDAGNVCAFGAVLKTATGSAQGFVMTPQVITVIDALNDVAGELGYGCAVSMNNDPLVTKPDILAYMEKAAIGLEERGQ